MLSAAALPRLSVCFVWHMHQPDYKDHLTGRYMMPWVRLHAVKDYLDMVERLEKTPRIRQTVNLVPSLIDQLEDYSQPGVWDRHQAVMVAEALTTEDKLFILERCFDANPYRMIARSPYYAELYERRNRLGVGPQSLSAFSDSELTDIATLFHLVWTDPHFIEKDPFLAQLWAKGSDFTQAERAQLLEVHRQMIARILPTYKRMQDAGQIEVTVTPYYHPILPLLIDHEAAHVARPDMALPELRFRHPEDAQVQLEQAIARYTGIFGHPPAGIWPSEQSVSPETVQMMAKLGVQWTLSSEGVLARSLGIHWEKDERGQPRRIEQLVQPYQYAGVPMVFRHLTLSDLIGFAYQTFEPDEAAEDCYLRLKHIQAQLAGHPEVTHPVVTIALDGENCWEGYALDGNPFLDALYARLSDDDSLNVCTVKEALSLCPPNKIKPLTNLHAGSWIEDNFGIWIGDPMKNTAWDYLSVTRSALVHAQAHDHSLTRETLAKAWKELYIAEGSDWFWWYGEPHHSGQDHLFDQQFRLHLQNVFTLIDQPVPERLKNPVPPRPEWLVVEPTAPIHPPMDARRSSQAAWAHAGRYEFAWGATAMHHGDRPFTRLWYGSDGDSLYLRVEFLPDVLKPNHRLVLYACAWDKIRFNSPVRLKINPRHRVPTDRYLYAFEVSLGPVRPIHGGPGVIPHHTAESIADHLWIDRPDLHVQTLCGEDLVDIALPLGKLHTGPGEVLGFTVAVAEGEVLTDLIPRTRMLMLRRPVVAGPVELPVALGSAAG